MKLFEGYNFCDFHGKLVSYNIFLLEILFDLYQLETAIHLNCYVYHLATTDDIRVWPNQLHAVSEVVSEVAVTFLILNHWS